MLKPELSPGGTAPDAGALARLRWEWLFAYQKVKQAAMKELAFRPASNSLRYQGLLAA